MDYRKIIVPYLDNEKRKKELKKRKNPDWFKKIDIKTLNSYLAIPLSKVFKVSDGVVAIALNDLDGI